MLPINPSANLFVFGKSNVHHNTIGGACGELKMLLKNTCEGVHLILTLLAISLPASKFTKSFHVRVFHVLMGGVCFSDMGGGSFLSGGTPWGPSILVGGGGGSKKIKR